jgi:hypothetical protein
MKNSIIHSKKALATIMVSIFMFSGCFSPSFPNTCFLAGTRIATPEGTVAIEDLQLGQSVLAYDEKTGMVVDAIIEMLTDRHVDSYLKISFPDGRVLNVTPDHPLALQKDGGVVWIDAGQLTAGDLLMTLDEASKSVGISAISSIESIATSVPVYNFKVRHYENSFAEGVLSHFYFENTHQIQTLR